MNTIKRLIYENVLPVIGYFRLRKNKYINVIYFHDIVLGKGDSFMRTNKDLFDTFMRYIADNGYESLRFDDLNESSNVQFKKKRILIAFDDGWLSNFTLVFDLMKSLGVKYNVFLTIGEVGKNPSYLTWDLVRKMHDSGLVGFGAHTYTHPHIADMSGIDIQIEFNRANEVFKKELGFDPVDFCYPFGSCSEVSHDYLTTHTNYARIYTSNLMYSFMKKGKIIFGRNGISENESFKVFKAKLNGLLNVFGELRSLLYLD